MVEEDLLIRVARGDDRDVAPFFAGRVAEIEAFEGAIENARLIPQTQFLIFQGAPGCGKTSLLSHLRENAPERRVFVQVDAGHLTSRAALAERVSKELHKSASKFGKGAAWIVRHGSFVAGSAAGAIGKEVADEIGDRTAVRAGQDSEVVLMLDEAQVVNANHEGVLRALHTVGLEGLHTVFAFAGLSRTGTNLRKLEGLSRLSATAEVHMGLLGEDECIESTRLMLARCEIGSSEAQHAATAQRVGAMAQRWPQHLACAHAALARELLRVERDLGRVDMDAVNRNTAEACNAYCWARLQGHPVLENAQFTARVVGAVHRQNANASKSHRNAGAGVRLGQVVRLCGQIRDAEPAGSDVREFDIHPVEVAQQMIERGILSQRADEQYRAAIPSMATWLGEHLPENDPAREYLIDTPASKQSESSGFVS